MKRAAPLSLSLIEIKSTGNASTFIIMLAVQH